MCSTWQKTPEQRAIIEILTAADFSAPLRLVEAVPPDAGALRKAFDATMRTRTSWRGRAAPAPNRPVSGPKPSRSSNDSYKASPELVAARDA